MRRIWRVLLVVAIVLVVLVVVGALAGWGVLSLMTHALR